MKSDITFAQAIPHEPPAVEHGSTMASALAETIRTDIIRGRLAPGMRLKVQELARLYDSGTIPVREALSRLTTSGFVYALDRRGFFVKEISREELLDLTRVRLMIEPAALRDSIEHGDIAWEEHVLSAHHRMSRLRIHADAMKHELDLDWEAAHDNFHRQLISACSSAWLLQFADTLRDQTTRYRHISVSSRQARDVAAEHAAILDACLARKPDLAVGLICDHINTTASLALSETGPAKQ
ncbi:GntR family transcriptional regulator [Eoetvoesiella caeni]|uniref:GntR family transcriptional regulator n=1 Tax=Eoetvoesiella caeni TaxID=645616 RepID=A0A366HKK7_9BURK|nr:GntR family transcriptional regulator [Eoetvoesiella caeni]MCI2807616.1 GntR family transcriptional regulator [Eoetvoesiella caeni]RBP42966.1 GntR family transcriptional regulator [Eoetvoesiella caeni]